MGDTSLCGFDMTILILILILTKSLILILFFVCACTRWGRFKRRGGGRYKCEPLSQAIWTPRAAKSHRPLPHHHADRGSSSRNPHHQQDHLYLGIYIINFCAPSSCRSRLVINHRGIHIISKIITSWNSHHL